MTEAFGGRWVGWAADLASRHQRIGAHRRRPALVLALARPALHVRCWRWRAAAWMLSPAIHLSVGPLLAAVSGPDRRVPTPRAPLASSPPATGPLSARPAAWVGEWQPAVASRQRRARMWRSLPAPAPAPLLRAVTRPHEVATAGRRDARLDVRRPGVIERVVHRRERVEIRRPAPAALLHRPAALPARDGWQPATLDAGRGWPAAAAGLGAQQWSISGLRAGAPFAAQAVPKVDLQRLTDQVSQELDRRIGAHRERMGRPR
jgi:hypothetical protein